MADQTQNQTIQTPEGYLPQNDPEFMSASHEDRHGFLMATDPTYARSTPEQQQDYLQYVVREGAKANIAKPLPAQQKSPGIMETARQAYEPKVGESTLTQIGKGLGRAATMLPSMAAGAYEAVTTPAKTPEEQAVAAHGGGLSLGLKRMVVDPSVAAYHHIDEMARAQKARETATTPEYQRETTRAAEVAGKGLSMVPLVGPFALEKAEQAEKYGVPGVASELIGMSAIPEVAEGVVKPVLKAAHETVKPLIRTAGTAIEAGSTPLAAGGAAGAFLGGKIAGPTGAEVGATLGASLGAGAAKAAGRSPIEPLIRVPRMRRYGLPEEPAAALGRIPSTGAEPVGPEALAGVGDKPPVEDPGMKVLKTAFDKAKADLDKAQAEHDAYKASAVQGINPPEKVVKALEKSQKAFDEAQLHYQTAVEAGQPKPEVKPDETVPVPQARVGKTTLAGGQGTMGTPLRLTGQVPERTQTRPVMRASEMFEEEPSPATVGGRQTLAGGAGIMGAPKRLTGEVLPETRTVIGRPKMSETLGVEPEERQLPLASQQGLPGGGTIGVPKRLTGYGTPEQMRMEFPAEKPAEVPKAPVKAVKAPKPPSTRAQITKIGALTEAGLKPQGEVIPPEAKPAPEVVTEPKVIEGEVKSEEKISSRPDKAVLQKAKATPEEIEVINKVRNTELRQFAINEGIDMGQKAVGRSKYQTVETQMPREELLSELLKKNSPSDLVRKINEGAHQPPVKLANIKDLPEMIAKGEKLPEVGGGAPETAIEEPKKTDLNYEEIAAWHNQHRGFTYNPEVGMVRDKPVFSVSGEHPELDKVIPGRKITTEAIKDFMEDPKVQEVLNSDARNSIGGWFYKNNSYLEISKLFDNKDSAIAEGKRLNQNSIYDHSKREFIDTGGTVADEAAAKQSLLSRAKDVGIDTKAYGNLDKPSRLKALENDVKTAETKELKPSMAYARMDEPSLLKAGWTQEQIDAGEHLPEVGGGKISHSEALRIAKEHLTQEEEAGVTKSKKGFNTFIRKIMESPSVQEFVDIGKAGEGARKFYQRSTKAFEGLMKVAPEYWKPEDRGKWMNFVASLSPQQSVKMNLQEALETWTKWHDLGRPEGKELEKLLGDNLTLSKAKTPNAMKALAGEEMWPDVSKNEAFKVPSFGNNLEGFLKYVVNDTWEALFGGKTAKEVSKPQSYHALSVITREAAKQLGWEPAEAQAGIWGFTQAFAEKGETLPERVKQYSEDFADLLAHDTDIRLQLRELGIPLEKLDEELRGVGKKPEITAGASPTTQSSIGKLAKRIQTEKARGLPRPKAAGLFDRMMHEERESAFEPQRVARMKQYP